MKKGKITVVSIGDPKDKKTWSGTTTNMYEALVRNGVEVDTMTLKNRFTKYYRRLCMLYLRLIKKSNAANFETTLLGARYWGKRAEEEIKKQKQKSEYYLCPAGASIIALTKAKAKFVDCPDATYKLMNDYYYSDVDKDSVDDGDRIDQLALQNSDKIILPSKWAYKSVKEDYHQSENKLAMIPFGANLPAVKIEPRTLDQKRVKLLLVGVEWKRKGVDIALDVLAELNKRNKAGVNYELTIVGLDKPADFTQKNVDFKGRLDKNNPTELRLLEEEYKKADIFILPTQAEAAGIVFAEAAMYALPTLTYATGGVGQYVLNDKTGYTLPKEATAQLFVEKIEEMVINKDKYHLFSNNAVKYYESTLNWDSWAENVQKFLEVRK